MTASVLAVACTGDIDTNAPRASTPLRRLSRVELLNSLRDVLGPSFTGNWDEVAGRVPDDNLVDGLDTLSSAATPSAAYVGQVNGVVEHVVEQVNLDTLAPCPAGDASCVGVLLDATGERIMRRPVTDDERSALGTLYTRVATANDHASGLRAVLVRLFESPDFLYHVAIGDPATGQLTDHEMAARLSFLLWETTPDDALLARADMGLLHEPADVEAQLADMLADPRTDATLERFYASLFRLNELGGVFKDVNVYPDFGALKGSMDASARRLLADAIADGDLETFLTSSDTYVDDNLAAFYGLPVTGRTDLERVTLDPARYAGILSHPAFLATLGKAQRSATILRGVFVLKRLLCQQPGKPPPGAEVIPPELQSPTTTRDFFANLTSPDGCQGCHASIDPLGWAFEHFDGMGRYRDMENGYPVDSTGSWVPADDPGATPITFGDNVELMGTLAGLPEVRRCVVQRWFRSRFGRDAVGAVDASIIDAMDDDFVDQGGKLRALAHVLASTPAFYRPHFDLGGR